MEDYSWLIGKKVKGFEFETTKSISFTDEMIDLIDLEGTIISFSDFYNAVNVEFNYGCYTYPLQGVLDQLKKPSDVLFVNIDDKEERTKIVKSPIYAMEFEVDGVEVSIKHQDQEKLNELYFKINEL